MITHEFNPADNRHSFIFKGRLDTLASAKIVEFMDIKLPGNEFPSEAAIVFDLNEVEYISSSFIRICISVAKQAGSGRFSIVQCQPFIKKTFKISGLDDILSVS